MRLTKLELSGFKSFAKKTEIQFDRGITAIVGPNGSGKSNIADSIRWVLGEQNARTLRGNKMEDVIFGGTETKKPQSYCEVNLVFENEDHKLPIDYSEVSIMRRVYRSGESEYLLNGASCRLKDIAELLRDTGLGKEGYSIVGQGKVEEILANKSGERRKAFEEAAGIMKYRVRKEEAERNLDNTKKNLLRLNDILSDLEERLEPLSIQSEAATEFLRLRDELRDLEINLFLYQYDRISEKMKSINDSIVQLTEELAEAKQQRTEINIECQKAEEAERENNDALLKLQNELVSQSAGVETKSGDIKVLEERIQNAVREKAQLKERITLNTNKRDEIKELLSKHDESGITRVEALNAVRSEVSSHNKELLELNKSIEEKEFHIEELKNSILDAMNRLGDSKSSISRFETIKATLKERLSELDDSEKRTDASIVQLESELSEAEAEYENTKSTVSDEIAEFDTLSASINQVAMQLNQAGEEIRSKEQALESKKSRLGTLMEMKRVHEGYYLSVKRLMQDAETNKQLKSCIEGTVAEIIKVPKEFEDAVEMSLSASLQNIVTPNEQSAKQIIEYLRQMNYGRATMLPVTSMKPKNLYPDERRYLSVAGCFGVASELIEFDPRYKNVIDNLLGRTIIVSDLDVGVSINRSVGQSLRIATLKGDIINPGGSMTGGSNSKREFSLLGRERECAELLGELNSMKIRLSEAREKHSALKKELDGKNALISKLSEKKHSMEILLATGKDKADVIRQQLSDKKAKLSEIAEEKERASDSLLDINEQTKQQLETQSQLDEGKSSTQADIGKEQIELLSMKNKQAEQNNKHTELLIRITALEKEDNALKNEQQRLEKELSSAIAMIEFDEKAIQAHSGEIEAMEAEKQTIDEILSKEREKNGEFRAKCKEYEVQKEKILEIISELREKRDRKDAELSDKTERLHKQDLNKSRSENDIAAMQDKLWNDYELTYENAQPFRREIAVTASNQRTDELKKAIKELGAINVNAIEEYKELINRYDGMKAQYEDLERAEADLVTLIDELVSTMEVNFKDKFAQIRENFLVVFTQLFGGGTADLILADESDILNCDIDILAQIPGKKLQSLGPLSGGERALTAIALQFAILGLKPTAFCLLDEIDASLDEANVTRFANYLHSYAEKTQFILITHRKGSMEACNAMYGVAQEEKGVSKVVSARINRITGE